ncbi:MAG: Nif3-like dinuclear metal center hexameric protein [Spirochaetaceae bacterium 4572_59]|nr:MAG: Nif3-like dinuclear metal center hexameric protein [Spirochaetaceae bacterium 4572_59]
MKFKLNELDNWCRSFLAIDQMSEKDSSLNGLQIGDRDSEVRKVAFAVDACLETFQKAVEEGADVLFVHHGLFWGRPQAVTGPLYKRFEILIKNGLALYAVHLPLDMHPEWGNNAVLAQILGLENLEAFGNYKGTKIGVKGIFPSPVKRDDIVKKLFGGWEQSIQMLPFGRDAVRSVGIISGGAPREVQDAIDEGLDLYITGDASHEIYHICIEAGINVIFGGHYLTETSGVQAIQKKMNKDLSLETVFIDVPTGL